jgi:hypothetical protein
MGRIKGMYAAEYPIGTRVRVRDRASLDAFVREWRFHHPLEAVQLGLAGKDARVKSVGFYHGGDELYELEDLPGLWHEANLESC